MLPAPPQPMLLPQPLPLADATPRFTLLLIILPLPPAELSHNAAMIMRYAITLPPCFRH